MLSGYGKIYNIGHACLMGPNGLLVGEIIIEEKLDGSQFSFGVINGEVGLNSVKTFFVRFGDLISYFSVILTLILIGYAQFKRFKKV